jgi:hypothetical protein
VAGYVLRQIKSWLSCTLLLLFWVLVVGAAVAAFRFLGEPGGLAALAGVTLLAVIGGCYAVVAGFTQRRRQLEAFARCLQDPQVIANGVLGRLNGRRVKLSIERSPRGPAVVYMAEVHNAAGEFTTSPAGRLHRFLRSGDGVDNVALNRALKVSDSSGFLSNLIRDTDAKRLLEALVLREGARRISLRGDALAVERPLEGELLDAASLERVFRSLTLLAILCDRSKVELSSGGLSGAHFVWTGGGSQARCPYCHDDIDLETAPDLMTCPECDTVHHRDCFEAGGCTVLGCSARADSRERAQA